MLGNYCFQCIAKRICRVLILVVLVLALKQSANATTYYISLQGSDSNSGTQGSPWVSLQHAIQVAGGGDTVLMRGGIYQTDEVWIRGDFGMGGSNGQYLTIRNYPGEVVSVGGTRRVIVDGAPYVRIEGLHFRLPYNLTGGGQAFQVVNNTFQGPQPPYGAIEFFADSGLIEGNVIEITGGGNTQDHAIYLHAGHNNVIRDNVLSGQSGYGIHAYDAVASGGNEASHGYANIVIEGNVVGNSQLRSGIIIAPDGIEARSVVVRKNIIANNAQGGLVLNYEKLRDIEVYNNVFYNNGEYGIGIYSSDIDSVEIINNAFSAHPSGDHIYNNSNITHFTVTHNLYYQPQSVGFGTNDLHPVFGNPMFIDPAGLDFHLLPNSPAIDAGIFVGLPFVGAAPDLGAFEYAPPASISDPSSLKPQQFNLKQNYPNPFNPATSITYEIAETTYVRINIFNMIGNEIKVLVDKTVSPGVYTVRWDGKDSLGENVATGVYFYRMKTFDAKLGVTFSDAKKLVLLR